ncbi:MAG: M3 family metallopeptidase [Alphaproteobacteria bacterium]|nr:M3 family metallopeptidase [Alphaproteobacteria bacterium]
MTAKSFLLGGSALLALTIAACDNVRVPGDDSADTTAAVTTDTPEAANDVTTASLADNPLLQDWDTPYGVPPFAEIADEDYMPAVEAGIAAWQADIEAIKANEDPASFENTIVALDKAGSTLGKVMLVFGNITNTDTNDTLSALEAEIYPMVTQVSDSIVFDDQLFARVKSVYDARETLGLDEQDARLVELTYRQFERAGATLSPEVKEQVAEINSEISSLTTKFGQNLLKSTKAFKVEVTDEADLAGLSEDFKAAIKDGDKWVLTVDRSVYETFMTQSENRDLRKIMFDGYRLRASEGEFDNGPIAIKLAQLRAKRAELLGYRTHAEYILEYNMARTPETVEQFLVRVWQPGLAQAKVERDEMQAMIGDAFTFEGHDWWHYSEKVRQQKYAFDDNVLKPYFELGAVRQGAFDMAERLFNISITPVEIDGWNPVVTSYDVSDNETGEHLGLFMADMYARDSKRGGAWMSGYRSTTAYKGEAEVRPIITNNLNLIIPAEGQPTLMRFDEVETLFHEFGHGLHGLLTQIRYQTFSGVDGPRDYTEFPAQLLEHWAGAPEMLTEYARHYETGEVIPMELVERMREAANHNQGFATTEFIAASLLDLNWHNLTYDEAMAITDAREFEVATLNKYGLIPEIEPRYRTQYFSHIFAGGYSSGYYAYLWAEILDADGFMAFREKGDIFDAELAAKLKKWVYESGGLRPADELYREFRGSDPTIEPLLRNRGFSVDETEG